MAAVMAPEFRGVHRRQAPAPLPQTPGSARRRVSARSASFLAGLIAAAVAALSPAATGGAGAAPDGIALRPWAGPLPPLALPALAPPGTTPLVASEATRLAPGRPLVVHFFATWCAPCREELASLDALAGDTGVAVVGVDIGEVPVAVARFLAEAPVAFPVLLDQDRAAAKAWGVRALPASFVLDAGLSPRLAVVGPLDWNAPEIVAALAALDRPAALPAAAEAAKEGTP